jgi:hypothetical protein
VARRAPLGVTELVLHHGFERLQDALDARGVTLERSERERERFDRRQAVRRRLAPDAIAARLARRERIARQRRHGRIHLHQLLRLPPRSIDDDERHGACGWVAREVARVGSRVEQNWRSRTGRHEPLELELDAHVSLRVR